MIMCLRLNIVNGVILCYNKLNGSLIYYSYKFGRPLDLYNDGTLLTVFYAV
jgi:hypothetical protein